MTMAGKKELIGTILAAETPRQIRVQSLASLVIWFAVGALASSAVLPMIAQHPPGPLWDAAAGCITVAAVAYCKLG
jgi:hypothetical protein